MWIHWLISLILSLNLIHHQTKAISKLEGDFYPYGQNAGDEILPSSEDSTSKEITFPKPVYFFGVRYRSAFVNENGLISFETDLPFFQNDDITKLEYSIIAPFYADIDIENYENPGQPHGAIYYRITEDPSLRERATRFVQSKFSDAQNDFEAKWLLVVTWDEVGYHDGQYDKKNTFQAVLIGGDSQSYVEFLYDRDGIQWIRANSRSEGGVDKPAQVGFISDDNRQRILEYSGTEHIAHVNRRSNVNEPGRYLFRVSANEILGPSEVPTRTVDRLQPLDIGGPSGVVGAGTHSNNGGTDDLPDDENDDYENNYDSDVTYDDAEKDAGQGGNIEHQPYEPPTLPPEPLAPAPPALGPDERVQLSLEPPSHGARDIVTPVPEPEPTTVLIEEPEDDTNDADEALQNPEPTRNTAAPDTPIQSRTDNGNTVERDPTASPPQPTPEPHHEHRTPAPIPYEPRAAHVAQGLKCADGGAHICHDNAECRDYNTGSCCQCGHGYFGNGRECLKEGEAQRINGRFYGRINNVDIPETDLHTYAVNTDGRVYTALSQIPAELGRPMLLLGAIGGVMGWLFAKPISANSYNGFILTGGMLNRTATVHISDRYTVTIQQEFSGKDNFNYLKAKVYVTGTLPDIPEGVEVEYGDYKEDYNRHGPGVIKSYSTKLITAGHERYQITIDQTIRYDECPHKTFDNDPATVLRTERSYNVYDPKERIVRYAAANTIQIASEAGSDPCREGNHDCVGPHMTCTTDGQGYRCTCAEGYELTYPNTASERRGVCVDVDECDRSSDRCAPEADCFNQDGNYRCVCKPGYRGNGYTCEREIECGTVVCDVNAECLPAPVTHLPECVCREGYHGNGLTCHSLTQTTTRPVCTSHDQCHRHGQCVYNEAIRQYQCQCRPPYSGDGRHCFLEAESCDKARNCDANADCIWQQTDIGGGYLCRCRPGFTGDGRRCSPTENPQDVQCNVNNNCHRNAQCKFDTNVGRFSCQCLAEYDGDGFTCTLKSRTPPAGDRRCQSVEDCHAYGHCVNRETDNDYVCECLPGFKGDGITNCEPADQCNPGATGNNQCDANAACVYDDKELAYVCKCNDGYRGDGKMCRESGLTCDRNPNLCHRDAQCVWDGTAYDCQCKAGFRGDGRSSCESDKTSCEFQNICHTNAQCQRNRVGEYRCVCNSGYEGDGMNCQQASDCLINPKLCDINAVCVSDSFRYVCRCKPGYHGSGQACSADSELRGRTLAFTQGVAVVQRGLLPEDLGKQVVVVPHQIAVGLDYDCQDDKLFWTDVSGHAIRSAYTDGSNLTTLFSEGLNSPEGLVVDWGSKNVYYTDSQLDIIGVARQDGKYRMALIKEGLVNPRALALDLFDRKLYYSDWYRQKPVIGRVNLDGTGREDFITKEIALPNGLIVLHRRRQLCWADAGLQRLECIGLNGSGRRVIFAPLGYPFGLAVHNEETFYWTDWEDLKIHTVTINGANHHSFTPSLGGSGKLYGIVLIPEQCPPGESPCAVNNGGCRFICLPDSRGSRSCVCPDNIPESECNELNGSAPSLL